MRRFLLISATVLLHGACSERTPVVPQTHPLSGTWVEEVSQHPERFETLMQASGKSGWTHLFSHEYRQAYTAFHTSTPEGRIGRARAAMEMARVYNDLAEIQRWVVQKYYSSMEKNPRTTSGPNDQAFRIQAETCEQKASQVDATTDEKALIEQAMLPVMEDTSESGILRAWYEPCLYVSLRKIWLERAQRVSVQTELSASPTAELALAIFSSRIGSGSGETQLALERTPEDALRRYGLLPAPKPASPLASHLRDVTDSITRDGTILHTQAPELGRILLDDLALVNRFRQDLFLQFARTTQDTEQRTAILRHLSQSATAASPGAGVPGELSLTTKAQIKNGRTRESLDTLNRLHTDFPETLSLQEWIGDLAILESLDRYGDSKEN